MDVNQDLRQNDEPINNLETRNTKYLRRISLATLFFSQFLLSQLVLSYGIYAVYFIQHNVTFLDSLWPPIIFLATTKICSPWLQILAESAYEYYSRWLFFIGSIVCSCGVAFCYFLTNHIVYCGILYGTLGGLGNCLILSTLHYHLIEIFPYDTNLVLGVNHFAIASGLFITPLIIKSLFDVLSISFVFLIHGSILLHIIIFGLLIGDKKNIDPQRVTAYNNLGTNENFEEEMIDLSLTSRNWKSPADMSEQEEYSCLEDMEKSSPILSVKDNTGPRVLSQILEEDEYDSDEEMNMSKRSSMIVDNNIKRMSVISNKLEDVIQKNKNGVVLISPSNMDAQNISLAVDQNLNKQEKNSCCTPYQKYKCKKRLKSFFICIYKSVLKPVVESIQIIEFYPSLLTNIHSILSPLIFLNFVIFRSIDIRKDINLTEIAFMFPIIAFAYLVFLIILPWITAISKRNLKYLYIFGCIISALGVYMATKTHNDDYIIISCLIYGFGFGAESYLKEIVLKEFLGVSKWSRVENTLNCLSGILFISTIFVMRNVFGTQTELNVSNYIAKWLDLIFCNHLIISSIWLVFPLINYLFDSLFYRNKGTYSFT